MHRGNGQPPLTATMALSYGFGYTRSLVHRLVICTYTFIRGSPHGSRLVKQVYAGHNDDHHIATSKTRISGLTVERRRPLAEAP